MHVNRHCYQPLLRLRPGELNDNLREVIEMLLEDGPPTTQSQFVGIQNVEVA